MTPEEKQTRNEFRWSLKPEQRATMAIGALILNWAQWDGDITQHVFFLRDRAVEKTSTPSAWRVSSLHKDRLRTLRRLVVALTSDRSEKVRKYDTITGTVAPLTVLRGAVAHGLVGLANPSGTQEDLRLAIFAPRQSEVDGELSRSAPLDMPSVTQVFEAADIIWDERAKLRQLVDNLLK